MAQIRIQPVDRVQHIKLGVGTVRIVTGYQVYVRFPTGSTWLKPSGLALVQRMGRQNRGGV